MLPPTDSQAVTNTPHYPYLDGLRGFLALYVVAHHIGFAIFGFSPMSPWFRILTYGPLSVPVFIILSGFCLMLPVLGNNFRLRNGLSSFFMRRALRILPPYFSAIIFSLLLIHFLIGQKTGHQWDIALPATTKSIVIHFLLLQNLFPDEGGKINFVFWSISVEWQIYFFFPLLLWGWRSVGAVWTTLATILISSLMEKKLGHFTEAHFLGLFALGMFAAYISFSSDAAATKYKAFPWRLIALAALPSYFFLKNVQHEWAHLAGEAAFGCFASALLIIASINPKGWLRAFLNFKPLIFVGWFSYSLYLIHAPLIQVFLQYNFSQIQLGPNHLCIVLLLLGLPLIALISLLFYFFFEEPFLRTKMPQSGNRPIKLEPAN